MAYFLGRDVAVIITTESITDTEQIGVNGTQSGLCTAGASLDLVFAKEMENVDTDGFTQVSDLTGVDVSIGATDEDITYIGQKGTAKVEIKKEMTVSLTRKKKNNLWDTIFNGPTLAAALTNYATDQTFGARWGLDGSGAKLGDGLVNPKDCGDGTVEDVSCSDTVYNHAKTRECNYSSCVAGCNFDDKGCPSGCKTDDVTHYCGDGKCDSNESLDNCSQDCGTHTSCPVNDFTTDASACNYTKCISGCQWKDGCPAGGYGRRRSRPAGAL